MWSRGGPNAPRSYAQLRWPARAWMRSDRERLAHGVPRREIEDVRRRLLDGGHADEDALKDIDREIRAEVNEAAEFAQNAPEPDVAELFTDILADTEDT